MREKYEDPRMEVYVFEEKDLIVCSTGEDNGSQDPNENEEFWYGRVCIRRPQGMGLEHGLSPEALENKGVSTPFYRVYPKCIQLYSIDLAKLFILF